MAALCIIIFSSAVHAQDQLEQGQQKQDMQQLLDRIDELDKQLRRLQEEGKARKRLESTEKEKVQQEKEVLEAVSREYTLDPKRTLSIDYGLSYSYTPNEEIITGEEMLKLRRTSDHNISQTITTTYSMLDNLSTTMTLPFDYRYNKRGTDQELDQTDLGDISGGVIWQPFKSKPGDVRSTLSLTATLPTGRSQYKINPDKELSTGNGVYSVSVGANFSKQVDPVVVFWQLGYRHTFDLTGLDYKVQNTYTLKEVDTGDTFSFGGGMGYALSYATTINMSFSYSYEKSTTLTYQELASAVKTGDTVSAMFSIGMGWRISAKTSLSFSLGYSLTDTAFSLSFRVPFTFVL